MKLERLYLSHTQVQNIERLAGLTNLRIYSWAPPPRPIARHSQTLNGLPEAELEAIKQRECPLCREQTDQPPADLLNTCGGNQTLHRACLGRLRDLQGPYWDKCPNCRDLLGPLPQI